MWPAIWFSFTKVCLCKPSLLYYLLCRIVQEYTGLEDKNQGRERRGGRRGPPTSQCFNYIFWNKNPICIQNTQKMQTLSFLWSVWFSVNFNLAAMVDEYAEPERSQLDNSNHPRYKYCRAWDPSDSSQLHAIYSTQIIFVAPYLRPSA